MSDTGWGVWLHAERPIAHLAKLAAAAEALGAAAILVADEGTDRDLFVTLAALAERTRRVFLFGAVTNPHSRHPLATAAAFASVAELAAGRVIAGFGTGGSRVLGPMALAPARPLTALRETIDVVQALWRGETVTHAGQFSVHAARLSWTPGPLPLAIAGRGPRVERLAAERADWILLAGRASRTVPGLVARLREIGLATRGRGAAIAWNPIAAWTDEMREDLRAHLAYMAVDMPEADRVRLGLDASTADQLRNMVNSRGARAGSALITDAVLDQYAIVGDRQQVVSRLAELRETVHPELLVFDAGDYTVEFLESLASLALDAGARDLHNLESLHGLDSND